MFCPNCQSEISDKVLFCPNCGSPVSSPVQQDLPVQSYSLNADKSQKKINPLAIILPVLLVAALIVGAIVMFNTFFNKPAVSVSDFITALNNRDFQTALELSEKISDSDCEDAVEDYIINLLKDSSDNDRIVDKMFSIGFDKYDEIMNNYQSGKYSSNSNSSSTAESQSSNSSSAQSSSSSTSEPVSAPVDSAITLAAKTIGHWKREVYSGCYEKVVFSDDGTGYICSDIVSSKISKTNPDYLYYDGMIHFTWDTDSEHVYIYANIDPYCFVAYQGYAAAGHYSNATWKGSKNGSHDYYFGYKTQDEYICDMLSIDSSEWIYTGNSLTKDYWINCLGIFDDAWNKYFNHPEQMDYDKYKIDYDNLEKTYYNTPELRDKFEDVDLYHFVQFTKLVLYGTDNPVSIKLEFNAEDYQRDNNF